MNTHNFKKGCNPATILPGKPRFQGLCILLEGNFDKVTPDNNFISELILAELKFGVENSEKPAKNKKALENFLTGVQILPIFHSLDLYVKEKTRLRKAGATIDDFDLLIGNDKIILKTHSSTENKDIVYCTVLPV